MSKPIREDQTLEYTIDVEFLYEILAKAASTPEDVKNLLKDLLTPAEIRMIANRWHIARLLDNSLSIREVAAQAKVGTDTVERVARRLHEGTGGLQKAIEITREPLRQKLAAQKQAETKSLIQRSVTRWVFGTGKV